MIPINLDYLFLYHILIYIINLVGGGYEIRSRKIY